MQSSCPTFVLETFIWRNKIGNMDLTATAAAVTDLPPAVDVARQFEFPAEPKFRKFGCGFAVISSRGRSTRPVPSGSSAAPSGSAAASAPPVLGFGGGQPAAAVGRGRSQLPTQVKFREFVGAESARDAVLQSERHLRGKRSLHERRGLRGGIRIADSLAGKVVEAWFDQRKEICCPFVLQDNSS